MPWSRVFSWKASGQGTWNCGLGVGRPGGRGLGTVHGLGVRAPLEVARISREAVGSSLCMRAHPPTGM